MISMLRTPARVRPCRSPSIWFRFLSLQVKWTSGSMPIRTISAPRNSAEMAGLPPGLSVIVSPWIFPHFTAASALLKTISCAFSFAPAGHQLPGYRKDRLVEQGLLELVFHGSPLSKKAPPSLGPRLELQPGIGVEDFSHQHLGRFYVIQLLLGQ